MRKIYFLASTFFVATITTAQGVDTLSSHFMGTPALYTITGQPGYLSGNNGYGDLTKVQLFDQDYGVVGPGTVSSVLLGIPVKTQNGAGTGTFMVKIWADNSGQPGTEAGSVTLTMADVDTSLAAFSVEAGAVFNVVATFSTPITIPAGQKFWAGVVLPTSSGDTLALYTNTDGDFADAATHAGENWSDNSFHTIGDPANWDADLAFAIFPIVNITALSEIEENNLVVSVYPNPTNGMLSFTFSSSETSHIMVRDLTGKTVARVDVNGETNVTADFTELAAGTYVFETISFEGAVMSVSKFVKQ